MAQSSVSTLIGAIKSKDWHTANESFGGIMQQKVADALHGMKKTIFKEEVEDDDKVKDGRDLETEDHKEDDMAKDKPVMENKKRK